jgi:chemotaxis protein MotB
MARRKQGEHASHERWLVSYADFITLLFAFFVVLYSTAQGDQRKAAQLAAAIQDAFQQLGVFPSATSSSGPSVSPGSTQLMPRTPPNQVLETAAAQAQDGEDPVVDIEQLRRELERQLASEIDRDEISLRMEPDGLVISLREVGFFNSGSPKLKQRSLGAFEKVAHVLAERHNLIRVEGHTDNVPIHTPEFASNWELSTARATEVIRMLLVEYQFPPVRLSAAGYGEYHPIASNETDAGRQVNRRVDIVVLYLRPQKAVSERTSRPQLKRSAYATKDDSSR